MLSWPSPRSATSAGPRPTAHGPFAALQQIRRLESELGVELLHRTTRRVELAPAGEVPLERARQLFADADSAAEDDARAARGEVGRLAIGFTGTPTYALLPALATGCGGAPGVQLELRGEMFTPRRSRGEGGRAVPRPAAPAGPRP